MEEGIGNGRVRASLNDTYGEKGPVRDYFSLSPFSFIKLMSGYCLLGRSGKDLLAADFEAVKSYGHFLGGYLSAWRIPLKLPYDPEAVASYFNRRPHLLLFRLLEV
jgi:hypothetical protein